MTEPTRVRLSSAAVSSTVVIKPCGLNNDVGGNSTLVVGHHDELFAASPYYMIPRADVASVMAPPPVLIGGSLTVH